jgi:hypothetical protein
MEIVDFFDLIKVQDILEALEHINLLRGRFHQHTHALKEDRNGCEDAQYCEDQSTDRVSNVCLRIEENNDGGDNDTDALNDISDDVDYGCSDVHVFVAVARVTVAT